MMHFTALSVSLVEGLRAFPREYHSHEFEELDMHHRGASHYEIQPMTASMLTEGMSTASSHAQASLEAAHGSALQGLTNGACQALRDLGQKYMDDFRSSIVAYAIHFSEQVKAAREAFDLAASQASAHQSDRQSADQSAMTKPLTATNINARTSAWQSAHSFQLPVEGYLQQFEGSSLLGTELQEAEKRLGDLSVFYSEILDTFEEVCARDSPNFECSSTAHSPAPEYAAIPAAPQGYPLQGSAQANILKKTAEAQRLMLDVVALQEGLERATALRQKLADDLEKLTDIAAERMAVAKDAAFFREFDEALNDIPGDTATMLKGHLATLRNMQVPADLDRVSELFRVIATLELTNPLLSSFFASQLN